MTYYLVDGVFLVALIVTSVAVIMMRRELKQLRAHHQVYASALDETSDALTKVGGLIRDLNLQGLNTVHQLIGQIEIARSVIDELKGTTRQDATDAERPAISSERRKIG